MTRQQAMEYDDKLGRELQDYASECGENVEVAKSIVDNFMEFIPDDEIKGMPCYQYYLFAV